MRLIEIKRERKSILALGALAEGLISNSPPHLWQMCGR